MKQVRKFVEWLSFNPTPDEIARALVTAYLTDQGVKAIRFGRINSDDSAMVLGQFGHADAEQWRHLVVPGSEWRQWTTPEIDIISGKNRDSWSPDSLTCVISLRERGVMQGNNVVEFTHPVSDSDKARVLDRVEDFCIPISLYLSFQNHAPKSFNPSMVSWRTVETEKPSSVASSWFVLPSTMPRRIETWRADSWSVATS